MEFKQLEAFVAVVEHNSFSEAARQLYLTQPTISAHIRALETELHSKLIIRTTKKMTVTGRGYQLYDSAIRMLEIRNNIIEKFTDNTRKMIDLGVSTIPSSYLLPELLRDFGKKCPEIYFHAYQSDSAGAIAKLLDGTVDLCLVGQYMEDESLCFIPFCEDTLVLAAPVNEHFLELQKQPVNIENFLSEPFLMREQGSGTKMEMDRFLERQGVDIDSLNVIARMNDPESIKKSIVNGLGISILSYLSVQDLEKEKQILLFPLEEPAYKRMFYIVYNKNRVLQPHVKQFLNFVTEYYQKSEK